MEADIIIRAVSDIFTGSDARDWGRVQRAMADFVRFDYSSLSGNPPSTLPARQLVAAWKNFLPGFDRTYHHLSAFEIRQVGNVAAAYFKGRADHFIGTEVWSVAGSYDAEMLKADGRWCVRMLRFNLEKQSGNTSLPGQATQIVNERNGG